MASLRKAIRGLMTGPGFHEFLIRGANDRLLTDRELRMRSDIDGPHLRRLSSTEFNNHRTCEIKGDADGPDGLGSGCYTCTEYGNSERGVPLELIAHVVEQRPAVH